MSNIQIYRNYHGKLFISDCTTTLAPGPGGVSNLAFLAVCREDYILKSEGSVSSSEFSF